MFILHSSMQTSDQKKVLRNMPKGVRKIVRICFSYFYKQMPLNVNNSDNVVSLARFSRPTSRRPVLQSTMLFLSSTPGKLKRWVWPHPQDECVSSSGLEKCLSGEWVPSE